MPELAQTNDEDIFIIYGFGQNDGNILYVQLDSEGKIRWTKHREIASEFTRDEAGRMLADAKRKGLRTFTTKVA